jgi:hypothetical protein
MTYMIPCQCCGRQLPDTWQWFECDRCHFRVCPWCLSTHQGQYSQGGYKCSRCAFGRLHPVEGRK